VLEAWPIDAQADCAEPVWQSQHFALYWAALLVKAMQAL